MALTSIVYEDNEVRGKHVVPYHKINATKAYLKHYDNMLLLEFFAKNETDYLLRRRAEHELGIARRKMEYMERHINFNREEANKGIQELKKIWASTPSKKGA